MSIRKVFVLLFFLLSIFFCWWGYINIEYLTPKQIITNKLNEKVTNNYLDKNIENAIKNNNYWIFGFYVGDMKS